MDTLKKYIDSFEKSEIDNFFNYLLTTDFTVEKGNLILKEMQLCKNKDIYQDKIRLIYKVIDKLNKDYYTLEPMDATWVVG